MTTRFAAALITLSLLAACGAEGDPIRPSLDTTVSVSRGGVNVGTALGLTKGPLSVRLGL